MKSLKILGIFLFLSVMLILHTGEVYSWGSTLHSEIVKDAYYYMEHSSYATSQQKNAAVWMTNNWGSPSNRPWDIIATGAVEFDELRNLCFDNDEPWLFHRHLTEPGGSWIPDWIIDIFADPHSSYTAFMHFLDFPSLMNNLSHESHGNRRGGIHNNIDGYNYLRHNRFVGGSHDDDYWVDVWMGNDDFCILHSGVLLDMYERDEGGRNENGVAISSQNHSCYTRWDKDHHNIIYAPIDNLSNYWFRQSQDWRSHPYWGPYYLGFSLHGVGDASEMHHVFNTLGWGHSEFESWASYWYSFRGEREYNGRSRWFDMRKVREALDRVFTEGGIPPYRRDVKWLIERLAKEVYNYSTNNWGSLWGKKPSKTTFYVPFDDYMINIYPKAVACAVAIMERAYYLGSSAPSQVPVMVIVKRFKLIDETNPEWAGADDVYARFVVTDGIRTVNTRIPSSGDWGMDEGDVRDNINVIIFDTPRIGNYLSISARVYDADVGDDDLIGFGSLYLTREQNWGKGQVWRMICNGGGPGEGEMEITLEIR